MHILHRVYHIIDFYKTSNFIAFGSFSLILHISVLLQDKQKACFIISNKLISWFSEIALQKREPSTELFLYPQVHS